MPGCGSRVHRTNYALRVWGISRQDLAALGAAIKSVPPSALLQAAALFGVNTLLKAVRWQRMLGAQRLHLPLPVAMAAGNVAD